MKTRKCTTGLVVSFFFAAVMVVTLHTTAGAVELTATSRNGIQATSVFSEEQGRVHCEDCNWGDDFF